MGRLSRVFHARSLLYAERLVAREPKSPIGLWYRAYARAMMRYHADALADLESTEPLRADTPRPAWGALIEPFCKFQHGALKEAIDRDGLGGWPRLLHFLAVENMGLTGRNLALGRDFLESFPDCQRVRMSLAYSSGVSGGHAATLENWESFTDSFGKRVGALPTLPADAKAVVANDGAEADLLESLSEADNLLTDDNGVTWAVLARYARETRFVQADARMDFLRRRLGVPAREYLESIRDHVSDHPLYPHLQAYDVEPDRQKNEYAALLARLDLSDLTFRQRYLRIALERLPEKQRTDLYELASKQSQWLPFECQLHMMRSLPWKDQDREYGRVLLVYCPYSPLARSCAIRSTTPEPTPRPKRGRRARGIPKSITRSARRHSFKRGSPKRSNRSRGRSNCARTRCISEIWRSANSNSKMKSAGWKRSGAP